MHLARWLIRLDQHGGCILAVRGAVSAVLSLEAGMCLATKATNLLATVVSHMSHICEGCPLNGRVGDEQVGCG